MHNFETNIKGKHVLIVGMAKSGIAAAKTLKQFDAFITMTDSKAYDTFGDLLDEAAPFVDDYILGQNPTNLSQFDLIVMSPGVPMDISLVKDAKALGVEVIGEIELAFRVCRGNFIGITGTNGKTTTTALVGEMFQNANRDHFVVGNIGIPAVSKAPQASGDTVMVTELSSFQLESIVDFKAHIAAIINITPDHLNRHKTMENYIKAKARIFENQNKNDFAILNADDPLVAGLSSEINSNVFYFSRENILDRGFYIQDDAFYVNVGNGPYKLMPISNMFIPGKHNVQNALVAIAIATLSGIDRETIVKTLSSFKGVEHRIAYVTEFADRIFYNDSKGTNPESTICAIEAMQKPTILIAGGMDKGSEFDELVKAFKGKIKALVLLGETKGKIKDTAQKFGFNENYLVENMEEAVEKAFALSAPGDVVLLSPACASWDMYPNFETRGLHFKSCVKSLEIRW